MSNRFLPVEGDTQNKFKPVEPPKQVENERSAAAGEDMAFNNSQRLLETLSAARKEDLVKVKQEKQLTNIPTQVIQTAEKGEDAEEGEVNALRDLLQNPDNAYNYYRNLIKVNDTDGFLSQEEVDDLAAREYTRNSLAMLMDDVGIGETAANVAGLIFLPRQSLILGDMFGVDAGVNSSDFVLKFAQQFRELPSEQKPKVVKELVGRVQDATENEMFQIITLLDLLGESSPGEVKFNLAADKLDVALTAVGGIGAVASIAKARRSFNALKTASKLDDVNKTADLINTAASSDKAAGLLGLNRIDVASSLDANKMDLLEGADEVLVKDVKALWDKQDDIAARLSRIQLEGLPIDEAEKLAIVESDVAKVTKDLTSQGKDISNVTGRLEDGKIVLEYNETITTPVLYKSGKKKGQPRPRPKVEVVPHRIERTFTTDDLTGKFIDRELSLGNVALSPMAKFTNDRELLVQAPVRITNQSALIADTITKSLSESVKGLNVNSRRKVNDILVMGNDQEKVFTATELLTGTNTGGIKLNRNEVKAYFGMRRVVDQMWHLEDLALTNQAVAQGLKRVRSAAPRAGDDVQEVLAKPYTTVEGAWGAYDKDVHTLIKMPSVGEPKAMRLTRADLEEFYNQGYVLTRAIKEENNLFKAAGTHTVWSLNKADEISDVSGGILGYHRGYIPQIGKGEHYFAKVDLSVNVDGVDTNVANGKTLATFDNKSTAEKWAQAYVDEQLRNGVTNPVVPKVLADREIEDVVLNADEIRRWGGLFNGKRSSSTIPHFKGDVETPRSFENVYEALQRNIGHIAKRVPAAEYRLGVEKVWMNTASEHLPDLFKENITFDKAVALVEGARGLNPKVRTFLLESAKQINYVNSIPTKTEEAVQAAIMSVGNAIEKLPGGKTVAPFIYTNKHRNPINAVKAGTFHAFLGMYNPAQYIIQGSGATVAMSIDPLNAGKAMAKFPAYTALDNITDVKKRRQAADFLNRLLKKTGMIGKDDDILKDWELWNATGMREGVIVNNIDAHTVYSGNPIGTGAWSRVLAPARKVVQGGDVFYKMGELVNTRISFFTALERAKSTGKPIDLKQVVNQAENFRLNMNKVNKAAWQKGFLGIPTQFQGVTARFAEAMSGGTGWTRKQRGALFVGQALLYGSLGIPFLDNTIYWMMDSLGVEPTDWTAQEYTDLREGMIGWMFNGLDAEVTSRTALGEGFTETVMNLISTQSGVTSFIDAALGPAATIKDRTIEAMQQISNTTKLAFTSGEELEPVEFSTIGTMYAEALAGIPSSTRKAWLAYHVMNDGFFRDSKGRPAMFFTGDKYDLIMQAMGFNSKEYTEYVEANIADYKKTNRMQADQELILKTWNSMWKAAREDGDTTKSGLYGRFVASILSGYDPLDQQTIIRNITENVSLAKDKETKLFLKTLREIQSEWSDAANNLNPFVIKKLKEVEAKNNGQ